MSDFDLLVKYVSDNISHDYDRWGMRNYGNREPLPYQLEDAINDLAVEWCEENGYTEDDYYDNYTAEDVFMSDQYDYVG